MDILIIASAIMAVIGGIAGYQNNRVLLAGATLIYWSVLLVWLI